MTTQTNKHLHKGVVRFVEYEEFILWYATPFKVKEKMGLETQKSFAEFYKLNQHTLSVWKERPEFEVRVRHFRKKWAFEKTMDVIQGMYHSAVKGNPLSQKLWMQVFEDFSEKSETTEIKKVEVGVNDIRFLIDALPEPMKTKHYDNLRELLDDASAIRNARLVESNRWDERPTETIPNETDQDAYSISSDGANAMAGRHTERVCENLEWRVSENNNQSTARRREK